MIFEELEHLQFLLFQTLYISILFTIYYKQYLLPILEAFKKLTLKIVPPKVAYNLVKLGIKTGYLIISINCFTLEKAKIWVKSV